MTSKTQTIPTVTVTTKPERLVITSDKISVGFKRSSSAPGDRPEFVVYTYTGADFVSLVQKDVGVLLGRSAVGITLANLAENLAVRIAVDRGDENVNEWTF